MSTEYPGLDAVARHYWQSYLKSVAGMGSVLLITGSLAAVVVLVALPEAVWYLVAAGVTYVLHSAGFLVRDIWTGDFEPSQSTFSSSKEFIALIVILGALTSTILLIGSVGGYVLTSVVGLPAVVGAGFAMYYAVVDLVLTRRGWWTPGVVVMLGVAYAIAAVVDTHRSLVGTLPVVGKRRQSQS